MKAAWERFAARVDALTTQERVLLASATLLVAVLGWYQFVYEPMLLERQRLHNQILGWQTQSAATDLQTAQVLEASQRDPDAPLRERLEDLELLVRHFEALLGVEDPIGPGVVERLRRRYFHENLRELAQLVRAARCEPELAGETTHHD